MGATMTQDEIEEMAELSGLYLYKTNEELIYCLTYFAKLVAAKEREECAKICDEHSGYMTGIVGLKIRAKGKE
jgi:hypothetical protein